MYPNAFIKLIEDYYTKTVNEVTNFGGKPRKRLFRQTVDLCNTMQKFKTWLTLAIRNADISFEGAGIRAEDVVIHYATLRSKVHPYNLLHPKISNAITVFNKIEFDDIFGAPRRLAYEKETGRNMSSSRFTICERTCFTNETNSNCSLYSNGVALEYQQFYTNEELEGQEPD